MASQYDDPTVQPYDAEEEARKKAAQGVRNPDGSLTSAYVPPTWGAQSQASVLPSTLQAGDPQYNQRQGEFESTVDWGYLENYLKDQASQRGVAYDPSDLAGVQRNAGYDQAHLGDAGLYNDSLQQFLTNAVGNYDQRASNTPGGSGGTGTGGSVAQQWNSASNFLGSNTGSKADDLYAQLLARSQQSLNVDRNDPNIRGQADAFSANAQRSRREFLNDRAEQAGPLGNLAGEQRLTAERLGQATGAFEAELMGRELTARRDEIAQALQLMSGRMSTEQALALQRELGLIDAQLQTQGLGNSYDLGLRNLGLNQWIAGDTSALNWARLV